jgi:hypothetical protein
MSTEVLTLFGTVFAALCTGAGVVWASKEKEIRGKDTELDKKDKTIEDKDKTIVEINRSLEKFKEQAWERITKLEVEVAKMHTVRDIGELFEQTLIRIVSPLNQTKTPKVKDFNIQK